MEWPGKVPSSTSILQCRHIEYTFHPSLTGRGARISYTRSMAKREVLSSDNNGRLRGTLPPSDRTTIDPQTSTRHAAYIAPSRTHTRFRCTTASQPPL